MLPSATSSSPSLLDRTAFIDLEVTRDKGLIRECGAAFGNQTLSKPGGNRKALEELDELVAGADFVAGHNIIEHDLPKLKEAHPDLNLLRKPAIDTLYLSPLAFPANPYHKLVKDYRPTRQSKSDPLADADLAKDLLAVELGELARLFAEHPEVLRLYRHVFETIAHEGHRWRGMVAFFEQLGASAMSRREALAVLVQVANGASRTVTLTKGVTARQACPAATRVLLEKLESEQLTSPWLAYVVAWLRVAGGNSVLPAWVRMTMPEVGSALRDLRDRSCGDSNCPWCGEQHDAQRRLLAYFGFETFRPSPGDPPGDSLQKRIVEAGMRNEPLLAVLPTGGGKSLCYQIPALARHQRRGQLTIVISPLQALMKDQVDGLISKTDNQAAFALNGMLTPLEREDVLQKVRLGDAGILYVSPEQLRNPSFEKAVQGREIGCWVFDEAHCLSKWGHDFRPDYLYASRFIRDLAEKQGVSAPPVACFTATAKLDVRLEINKHFRDTLGQELHELIAADVGRPNLSFAVKLVALPEKLAVVNDLLERHLAEEGAAVVFCSTRRGAEETSRYLLGKGWNSAHYHAGLDAAEKRSIQERFMTGTELRVICATNAFGMGIDKEDVRLVIHADIPGSLENYIQEAGRAGRDQMRAECILLYAKDDVETQFKLAASSRLSQRDLAQILKKLRREAKRGGGEVVITAGELLRDSEVDVSFSQHDRDASTRVTTAVSWLEQAHFVERKHNVTRVFQGRAMVRTIEEAESKARRANVDSQTLDRWLHLFKRLLDADPDEGLSADSLAEPGRPAGPAAATKQVLRDLSGMTEAGLLEKGLMCSAIVWTTGSESSKENLLRVCELEKAMLGVLREAHPDFGLDDERPVQLHLRQLNERLRDGVGSDVPRLQRLLRSLSEDGRGLADRSGSIQLTYVSRGVYRVRALRHWGPLEETADLRRKCATVALQAILAKTGRTSSDGKHFVDFGLSDIEHALKTDIDLKTALKDPLAAAERALMFLHEQKVIVLQKGLAVFRQAMTIQVPFDAEKGSYTSSHYERLSAHYSEKTLQVHVVDEYARRGLEKVADATELVSDYFLSPRDEFVRRYFPGRDDSLERATSDESFKAIIESLENRDQERIVSAPPDKNMLTLAGPGSGKTRVVVHRCAALLRVHRVPARGILIVCFNRSTVRDIRKRLRDLVGNDSVGVTIQTYHGLALRLAGRSLSEMDEVNALKKQLDGVVEEATRHLTGEALGVTVDDNDLRDALLSGYSHVLVDEYQDIDEKQYALLSAITGRKLRTAEERLSILAVGDDDQNIYSWRGSKIEFIKRFEEDYQAERVELIDNYRSTAHIIEAGNRFISRNSDRLKSRPIRRDPKRLKEAPGGRWAELDPEGVGRVQVVVVRGNKQQVSEIAFAIQRLEALSVQLRFVAVLARTHDVLHEVRAALESIGMPVRYPLRKDDVPPLFRVREVRRLIEALRARRDEYLDSKQLSDFFENEVSRGRDTFWDRTIREALTSWTGETGGSEQPVPAIIEGLYQHFAEMRATQSLGDGVLLSTIHSAKGLEFDHVIVADGGWQKHGDDTEAMRRLAYVAMTRARETLCIMERDDQAGPWAGVLSGGDGIWRRRARGELELPEAIAARRYEVFGLDSMWIGYAGRSPSNASVHRALRGLEVDDEVRLERRRDRVYVLTRTGLELCALSKKASRLWRHRLDRIVRAKVLAMVQWRTGDEGEEYRNNRRVDVWEFPILEVEHLVS